MRRPRRKKAVPMTWKQFAKRLLQLILTSTWSALCLLRYLNPFLHIRKKLGYFHWTKSSTSSRNQPLQKSWLDTLKAYFRSEEATRRQLLSWVQAQIPALQIGDLSISWCDGIALCALVDSICPGACPRYDLLKRGNKLNNCRLALKLAQKHLGVPQDIVMAEEIASPQTQHPEKIQQLLSMIQFMYGNQTQPVHTSLYTGCTAKGSGLVSGVVGKKCNVKVIVPSKVQLYLAITIRGPNQEFHQETIRPSSNRNSEVKIKETTRGAQLWKIGASKVLKNYGNQPSSSETKKIHFEYKETPEGHFDINYIPHCTGIYKVSIKWKESHINGSPFSVNIAATEMLKELKKPLPTIITCDPTNTSGSAPVKPISASLNFLKASNALLAEKDTSCTNVATAVAIFQRSSTLHRSISKISGPKQVKQGVVTRRKILKRIITKSGQEIIINAASISSNSVSSQDSDGAADRNDIDKDEVDEVDKKQVSKDKHQLKSFDFEGAYESDSSSTAGELSEAQNAFNVPIKTTDFEEYVIEELLNSVFIRIKRKEQIMLLQKKKELFQQSQGKTGGYSSGKCIPFGRGKRHFSTSALLVPAFQKQFHCSPYSATKEEIERTDPMAVDVRDEPEKDILEYSNRRLSCLSEPSLPSFDSIESISKYDKKPSTHESEDETVNTSPLDIKVSHYEQRNDNLSAQSEHSSKAMLDINHLSLSTVENLTLPGAHGRQSLNITSSTSSDSSLRDTSSGTDSETPESGPVSVRTQQKDYLLLVNNKDYHSDLPQNTSSVFNMQPRAVHSHTWWPSKQGRRKSESEISSFNYSRASSLNRLYSISSSPFSLTYTSSCSQEDDVFASDPSSLKLLTSDSMQKSCLYFSNSPVKEDNNTSSFENDVLELKNDILEQEEQHKTSAEYKDTVEQLEVDVSSTISETRTSRKLHSSRSLPNLAVTWKAFDINLEKQGTLHEEEIESMSQPDGHVMSKQNSAPCTSEISEKESNNYKDDAPEKSSVKEDEGHKTTSHRGSLARQQEVVISENTSGSEDHSEQGEEARMSDYDNTDKKNPDSWISDDQLNTTNVHTTREKCDQSIDENEETLTVYSNSLNGSSCDVLVNSCCQEPCIIVPPLAVEQLDTAVAKVEQSTQVSSGEIKEETGWKRPSHFLLRRRHPISVQDIRKIFQSVEVHKRNRSYTDEQNVPSNNDKLSVDINHSDKYRQKTYGNNEQETESNQCFTGSLVSLGYTQSNSELNHEHLVHAFTKPDVPLPTQKQYLNGHKMLTRNRYRGKIKLDPLLVSQDPNAKSNHDILPRHSLLKKCVSTWTNSTRRPNSVVNEKCWRRWKKQLGSQSKHGIRKRVKFSNRVLLHRRSSSRSTKCSSQTSKDSLKDLGLGSGQQHEEKLTRTFQTFRPISTDKEPSSCTNSGSEGTGMIIEVPENASNLDSRINSEHVEVTENKDLIYSSVSSDGFGMDSDQRKKLLKEVDQFRRLTIPLNNDLHLIENKSINEDSIKKESPSNHQIFSDRYTDDETQWQLEHESHDSSSLINQMSPLGEDYVSFTGLLDDSYQDPCVTDRVSQFLDDDTVFHTPEDLCVPVPTQCVAFGSGLHYGQVGAKNNFQVRSLSAGHGSLGVAISGPRPHTVVETNVTYTGDDLYEVIYEVKYPGFYVIAVKWADRDIPQSPFICKVTF